MIDLHFNQGLATGYHSGSQISRVVTEDWVARNMFCPICGAPVLGHYEANKPVADFFCDDCKSDFELKSKESKKAVIGHKIADVLNVAMFGMTAKQWREANPDLKGNIRDYATINELICLSNMENINAVLINDGMPQGERLVKLNQIAIQQMQVLEGNGNRNLLK